MKLGTSTSSPERRWTTREVLDPSPELTRLTRKSSMSFQSKRLEVRRSWSVIPQSFASADQRKDPSRNNPNPNADNAIVHRAGRITRNGGGPSGRAGTERNIGSLYA